MQIQEARLPSIFVVPLVQVFLGVFFFISLLYGFRDLILFTRYSLGHWFRCEYLVPNEPSTPRVRSER